MRFFRDIRLWILAFFALRLIGISNPPLESHAWRQTIVNMVSQNYLEKDPNILYPRVSIMSMEALDDEGVSPMEFPIMNYLIFLCAKVFGWNDWFGRVINLIVSSFGLWYFYLIVRKFFSERWAFFSTLLLTGSIWLTFSRKIMPDTFSVSLAIMGLYYGFCYLDEETVEIKNIIGFFVFSTLGILSKIPSIYFFPLLLFPLLKSTISLRKKITLITTGLIGLFAVIWWYFIWCPELITRFHNRMFFVGATFSKGFGELINEIPGFLEHFYKFAFSYSGFALFVGGSFFMIKNRQKKLLLTFITVFPVYFIFVLKSGHNFVHHNYYIIPFVPILVLIAGYLFEVIQNKKIVISLLLVFFIDNISRKQHDFRIPEREKYRLEVSQMIDPYIPKKSLIAINGGASPVDLYFLRRHGWSLYGHEFINNIESELRRRKVEFIVINKNNDNLSFNLPLLFENNILRIYKL